MPGKPRTDVILVALALQMALDGDFSPNKILCAYKERRSLRVQGPQKDYIFRHDYRSGSAPGEGW